MLAYPRIHVQEDHSLLFEILTQRVVDDLALVLRPDAGQELPLRLGNAEFLEGVLDVFGNFIPGATELLCWPDIVENVAEVDIREIRPPVRHRPLLEMIQRLQPEVAHPIRLT